MQSSIQFSDGFLFGLIVSALVVIALPSRPAVQQSRQPVVSIHVDDTRTTHPHLHGAAK